MADLDTAAPGAAELPAGEAPAETSLRDDIDAAFAESESADPAAGGRSRDESGRFAPKAAPATQAPARTAAQSLSSEPGSSPQGVTRPAPRPVAQDGAQVEPAAPELRAPAQWKPAARERWAGVDPEIKSEITRREREFQTHLQQSSGLRDFVQAFEDIVRPYEMFIRAENSNPLAAVSNLFQTAAALRVETPANKARLVAGLCQQYAIDLQLLDNSLDLIFNGGRGAQQGGPQGGYPQQPQVFQDPRVDQFILQQAAYQQQQAEAERAEITYETQRFAQGNEFFDDVRMDMADMIEMAARRGQILPVAEAYQKACAMHPEVSKILMQRASGANARLTTQAALRARRAAASVKGESSPHGATMPANDSLRASIEAAFEQAGNSRL